MTVRELGALLRTRKASCVELVEESLNNARSGDRCNTFITLTADSALEEAAQRDKELAAGRDRGPFHGIPVAYKDLFYTKGVRTTAGSLIYRDFEPEYDATVVERFREAGAVSIGKLNLHELAYGATSKNSHYGFVLNPRDTTRIAGGSSGGSATAIAQGFVPVALGSDTGGSIRIPASFCGVVGFKPTYGAVSRYGVFPLSHSLDHVGPLGATAEDCALAMAVIAGRDVHDRTTLNAPRVKFPHPPPATLAGVRVGVPRQFFFDHVSTDVAATVRNAIERMAQLGAILVDVALPDIVEVSAVARLILWCEASSLYERHRNPAQFGPDVWQLIEQGRSVAARDYVTAQKLRSVFRRKFDAVWREVDLIAAPATAITAPLVEEDQVNIEGYIEDARVAATRLARAVNLIGEPAVSLPCGQDANGLPVGLQLISKPFRGPWLLAVAEMLGSRWS